MYLSVSKEQIAQIKMSKQLAIVDKSENVFLNSGKLQNCQEYVEMLCVIHFHLSRQTYFFPRNSEEYHSWFSFIIKAVRSSRLSRLTKLILNLVARPFQDAKKIHLVSNWKRSV